MEDTPKQGARSSLLPVILIAIGVFVLLGNLGWFRWDALLGILDLWPVAVLAVGVDMLTRGRYRVLVIIAAIVLGGIFYATWHGGLFGSTSTIMHTIEHDIGDAQRAEVRLDPGIATLQVGALSGGDALVRGTVELDRRVRLSDRFSRSGSTARLVIGTRSDRGFLRFGGHASAPWDLSFARGVPIDLDVDAGVGRSTLDLRALQVTDLELDGGVGVIDVTLPATGMVRASIDAGAGKVTVRVPRGMAASIRVDRGIGSVNVSPAFPESGNGYRSPGYDTATNRTELDIDGGVGSIVIEQVP